MRANNIKRWTSQTKPGESCCISSDATTGEVLKVEYILPDGTVCPNRGF